MRRIVLLVCVIATLLLASCDSPKEKMYTRDELEEAIYEAESRAYKRGYDEGEYYAKGEFESMLGEALDSAYEYGYEAGYEAGYEDGYDDCSGGNTSTYDPETRPRIKKD